MPVKVNYKRRKEMTLQFVPKMAGIFFTPGVNGRAEGDQKIAHIVRKKTFTEIFGADACLSVLARLRSRCPIVANLFVLGAPDHEDS